MIETLFKSLRGTDWEMLSDFVSPVFFEIVPTFGMASVFASIVKDYANKSQFARVKVEVNSALNAEAFCLQSTIKIVDHLESPSKDIAALSDVEKKQHGELILQLYFAQLFHCSSTILDLRAAAFGEESTWAPKPLYYNWSKNFRDGSCAIYKGFYQNNQSEFESGLKRLNLAHASDIFKSHFGEGGQDSVTFTLAHFKKSFHGIFVSCKEHRAKLHPEFFALGVYLVCLYEHLEALGVPLDVRSAFNKVVKS